MGLQIKRVVCNQVSLMCIMCYVCLLQMADESRKKLFKRQLYDFDLYLKAFD